ncbi:hypothetical protein ES703_00633 [subsurface metagenome]
MGKEAFLAKQKVAHKLQDYGTAKHTRHRAQGIVGVHQGGDAQNDQ